MTERRIVLLGTGMFAEELTDTAAAVNGVTVVAYCENLDITNAGAELNGRPVVWVDELPYLGAVQALSAITTTQREAYVRQVQDLGISFATLVHPTATIAPTAVLGDGVVVQPGAVIGARTTIGDHVTINRGALIGHHVAIGELATVQAGAIIGGATEIGARSYIGLGARVLERRTVGPGAMVAAGAVVVRDVDAHAQVMGVPARVVKRGVTGYNSGAPVGDPAGSHNGPL